MVILGILLGPMYYIPANKPFSTDPEGKLENIIDAFTMMGQNWQIMFGVIGTTDSFTPCFILVCHIIFLF